MTMQMFAIHTRLETWTAWNKVSVDEEDEDEDVDEVMYWIKAAIWRPREVAMSVQSALEDSLEEIAIRRTVDGGGT